MIETLCKTIIHILGRRSQDAPDNPWVAFEAFILDETVARITADRATIVSAIHRLLQENLAEPRDHSLPLDQCSFRLNVPLPSRAMVGHLSRHLVGLGAECSVSGVDSFYAFSGFVLSVGDIWLWVTAGHCIDGILRIRGQPGFHSRLLDGFGEGARHTEGLPFDVATCDGWRRSDEQTGIDIAFLVLPDIVRRNLVANNTIAMDFASWRSRAGAEFSRYFLCGVPDELRVGTAAYFELGNCVTQVFPVAEDEVPPFLRKETPRFYAKVPRYRNMNSIVGMSGGPIFAVTQNAEGQSIYCVHAIQSGWDPNQRILAACPESVFGPEFEASIARYVCGEADPWRIAWQ